MCVAHLCSLWSLRMKQLTNCRIGESDTVLLDGMTPVAKRLRPSLVSAEWGPLRLNPRGRRPDQVDNDVTVVGDMKWSEHVKTSPPQ